jgi:NADH:ubiquinone oxidoreductase subunit F (NADH-binding)
MSATALPRLLAGADPRGGASLTAHLEHHGLASLRQVDPRRLVAEVERAGLRGRGGAAFPTATKLAVVAHSRRPVVVANGAEGEPASAKDATLLAQVPHLVLDGLQLAVAATGADRAYLCICSRPTRAPATHRALLAALAERDDDRRDAVPVELVAVPDGYVSGEESALVHLLNGGRAVPTAVPPRPFERGVGGRPTLVQNVETLAHAALIARHGADWFSALGTPAEPGTALVTLRGAVARPGVREIALGTSLETLVAHAGGELAHSRGVLIGGYFGTWLDPDAARAVALDGASLQARNASLGCGVVAVLPADACPVAETARLVRWLAGESAGQCGPCVFGLAAIAGALEQLVARRERGRPFGRARRADAQRVGDPLAHVRRWCGEIAGRGACRHPDGAVRLVASALKTFDGDFEDHLRHGHCGACARPSIFPLPGRDDLSRAAA